MLGFNKCWIRFTYEWCFLFWSFWSFIEFGIYMPIVFEFSWLGWMTTAHRPCFDHGESWKWVGLSLDDLNEGWGVNHENYG